ncbi:uncharacterized protein LOC113465825 [Diaphorina citri]|uniref:Uncharacterized protein LOC113465825 n=1 Tax=Diaphorina citri TaxID=121845 RepID=A0A3Q0IJN9_DIACI|nr:uncharacterized protein LOC113465825 [Diaphorina citri]
MGSTNSFASTFSVSSSSCSQTTIKVFAKCLRSDIEYKTLGITFQTTCREVVTSLLNKYRMRHRDRGISKYKSLLISDRTTVDDLIQILLNCYSSTERVEKFSLYEYLCTYTYLFRLFSFQTSWCPELPSIPSSSRLSLSQPETASTSLLADYDNYFYI